MLIHPRSQVVQRDQSLPIMCQLLESILLERFQGCRALALLNSIILLKLQLSANPAKAWIKHWRQLAVLTLKFLTLSLLPLIWAFVLFGFCPRHSSLLKSRFFITYALEAFFVDGDGRMTFAKEKYPAFDWIFERNIYEGK